MHLATRSACLLALVLASPTALGASACPPAGWDVGRLQASKAKAFSIDDGTERHRLALALLPCLSSPDPALRDGVAFEAWAGWLRAGLLDEATRRQALVQLQSTIAPAPVDQAGFAQPFAALVLAELARSDRMQAWLTPAERAALVESAASYVESVRDYRGFIADEGWRHGVAHGADLLMQLALNPALDKAQLDRILAAVAAQVAPTGHAYVFGEPERLARPALFVAVRGLHSPAEWTDWLARVAAAPAGGWSSVFADGEGLARRHDVRAFLLGMYVQARDSQRPPVQALLPGLRAQLELVP